MDKKVLVQIKKDLLKRKKEVEEALDHVSQADEHDKDDHRAKFPDFGSKSDENAQEIGEYSTNLATEQILENTLRDINNALDRIAKGVYGVCKYCKEEIGDKRLLARPVASACVKCKTKLQSGG